MSHYDGHCAWCGWQMDESDSHEIATYDEEEGNETGYELVCRLCFGFLLSTQLEN